MGEKKLKDNKFFPKDCPLFLAFYERRKRSIQYERYEQAKEQAEVSESSEMTSKQIEEIVWENVDLFLNDKGRINVQKMLLYLRREHKLHVTTWKGYTIRGMLEAAHPEKFEKE